MPGVGHGHGPALVGTAHLHDDEGHAPAGRVVRRQHEGTAVLEALDVGGDDTDLVLVGEVAHEVGDLEVDLVPGGCPVGERDAELLALEDRTTLMAALRDEGDLGRCQVVAEGRVRVLGEPLGRKSVRRDAALDRPIQLDRAAGAERQRYPAISAIVGH